MNEFQIRLKLLDEILIKKLEALTAVLNICINEETILISGQSKPELLRGMAAEKQANIDVVLDCDEIFQTTFEQIREGFESEAGGYKLDVRNLQKHIAEACDMDIKIRLQEGKNKKHIADKNSHPQNRISKDKVAKLYERGKELK